MRYIFAILFFIAGSSKAQSYKDKCIEGNCRNGFGLLRVQTGTDPLPKIQTTFNQAYYYYVMGEFKNGKLNGRGCRFEVPWNFGNFKPSDDKYGQMVKDKILPLPDSSRFWWFETGNYADNKLNGAGFLADYNYGGTLNTTYFIRQGNFKNGRLEGEGAKITTQYVTYFSYDSLTKKNRQEKRPIQTIIHGSYANDACVSCTKSSISTTGVWGNITGEKLDDDFFSGWIIKDYVDSATKGNVTEGYHFIKKPAYKTLYVGGIALGKEVPDEQMLATKKVDLGNGKLYEGEVDANERPFGFGEIRCPDFYYKGFVDQGQPNGYGIYHPNGYGAGVTMGGNFEYGKLISGAAYMGGGWPKTIRCYGYTKNTSSAAFNLFTGFVYNGDYVEKTYDYDIPKRKYKLTREISGYMINGQPESQYVSTGKTDADIVRQRTVTNGMAAFNDIVIGDVIVLNGLASPVTDNKYMRLTLLDGRYIAGGFQNPGVQLSKHQLNEFEHSCTTCKGKLFTTVTYTPPPQVVTHTHYTKETIVGDFIIWTRNVPVTTTYTKTFAPVTRKEFCTVCNGRGKQTIAAQLKE